LSLQGPFCTLNVFVSSYSMQSKKVLLASTIGTSLEFYDYTLYGVFAPILAEQFFPGTNHFTKLMMSLSVFAVSFFVRPIGGAIFGFIGDFWGRKKALMLTIILMGGSTFLIGLMPTYEQIGLFAPIFLTICRLIQGFCAGGEHNGSAIFVIEHSKTNRQGIKGAFVYTSAAFGNLIALLAGSLVLSSNMPVWGWRLPFIFSIVLAIIGLYFRCKVDESPEFRNMKSRPLQNKAPSFYKKYKASIFKAIGVGGCNGILIYMLTVYMNIHVSSILNYPLSYSISIVALSLMVVLILTPIAGYLADRYGYAKIMSFGCLITFMSSYFIFKLMNFGGFFMVLSLLTLAVCVSLFAGPMHAFLNELFPPNYRYRGITICFSIGLGLFGGTIPLLSSYLVKLTNITESPCVFLMFGAILGFLAVNNLFVRKSTSTTAYQTG